MRKRRDFIQLAILAVLGLGVVFALVLPEFPNSQTSYTYVEISVFLQEGDIALTSNTRLGMEAAAADYGAQLRFVTPPAEENHDSQMALISREIEGGSDALIVSPIDPAAMEESIYDMEIPVIALESEVTGATLSITPDNSALGAQVAQGVLEDGHSGTILLLDTAGSRTGVWERIDQCRATLEEAGCIVVTASLSQLTEGYDLWDIDAIVALDYQSTLSMASWENSQAIHHQLYGVGGSTDIAAYLERGILQATVTWSDYATGYLAVQRAVESAQGLLLTAVPTPTLTTIRGETIYDSDNQKLLFPVI